MSDILISKKHGVNPTMGICENCQEDTGEVICLGLTHKYRCKSCGREVYGQLAGYKNSKTRVCPSCQGHLTLVEKDVEAPRHLPMGLCDKCQNEMMEIVKSGGVFWKCKDCGSFGVIKPESPVAQDVRETTGIKAPGLVGVEVKKSQCPVCGGE